MNGVQQQRRVLANYQAAGARSAIRDDLWECMEQGSYCDYTFWRALVHLLGRQTLLDIVAIRIASA